MNYTNRRQPVRAQSRRFPFSLIIFIIAIIYVATMLLWPIQAIEAAIPEPPAIDTGSAPAISWPAYGQSAIGTSNSGVLVTSGEQTQIPIASITKIVTALVVLEKRPITSGQTGPTITLTAEDAIRYNQYFMAGGSIARADAGMQLTQYQMLQAALITSANNYADGLAIWAYGSMDNYLTAANDFLAKHNLSNTKVVDATGFSPGSQSTASELVVLGGIALENPVIADIVAQKSATIPGVGILNNTNLLLGQNGVVGIKTGTTDEAGSCLLYAVKETIGTETVTFIGATLGGPNHVALARDINTALSSVKTGFKEVNFANKGASFATYTTPWGTSSNAITEKNNKAIVWSGQKVTTKVDVGNIKPGRDSGSPGSVTFMVDGKKHTAKLLLDQPVETPSWLWRITHPTAVVKS